MQPRNMSMSGVVDLAAVKAAQEAKSKAEQARAEAARQGGGGGVSPADLVIDVDEAGFELDVLQRSTEVPVVIDFWAEWCEPCKQLSPVLERLAVEYNGRFVLAKVDVDANQALAARFGVQGIPAVKAFRDGAVIDEFVGAVPKAKVEQLFDSLVPSRADELLAAGDELSLREAAELEPRRADIAVALARKRLERGADDEALEAVKDHEGDFAAQGIAARIGLTKRGVGLNAFEALDRGEREGALDSLLEEIASADEETREQLRRAVVGILTQLPPADPAATNYRRRLATALY
jgi:thioredoxin